MEMLKAFYLNELSFKHYWLPSLVFFWGYVLAPVVFGHVRYRNGGKYKLSTYIIAGMVIGGVLLLGCAFLAYGFGLYGMIVSVLLWLLFISARETPEVSSKLDRLNLFVFCTNLSLTGVIHLL